VDAAWTGECAGDPNPGLAARGRRDIAARSVQEARNRSDAGDGPGSPKASAKRNRSRREKVMLYTIAVVLLVLWLLGLVSSTTMGGFIHILLVIAIVVVLVKVITGRRVL
jgi:hypothetical protein